ncbi:MAG: dihydroorotase [Candidatus Methylopumilus sp.]|nr:dihydroorotase [Candidatus Methylopumilus sp.]
MTKTLKITTPDDFHVHLRDDVLMASVVPYTAKQFARALVMPNLKTPITTVDQAIQYESRIKKVLKSDSHFQPLMTLYLTDNTSLEEIKKIPDCKKIVGIKYYPAGATTNSDSGVKNIDDRYNVFELMEKLDVPLLLHGEVVGPVIDIFDREKVFIDNHLLKLHKTFPNLRVVLEHITTKEAADFILSASKKIAATITPQHLLLNRNHMFVGGINPHHYCLPVLKREIHRQALLNVVSSGNAKFFLGTDSAPHLKSTKENTCGCAGIFSAASAIELYAAVFDELNVLDKLEGFASFYGADFYGLDRNRSSINLIKEDWTVPEKITVGDDAIIPLYAGRKIPWRLT